MAKGTKSQNTTKELLKKTAEDFEETVVGTDEVNAVKAGAEAKYMFVHEDEYLYIPDINRRNMGHQFIKGKYETDSLEIAKYIYNFSGVICLMGKEDLVDLY